tara:strand:+ start:306 stop:1208 length:903 start_codon:yes stop_codon:yes gene_type:complete
MKTNNIVNSFFKNKENKILIIGANGMIGHMLFDYFCAQKKFETIGLVRSLIKNVVNKDNLIKEENFTDPFILKNLINNISPNLVINCIGIVKQNSMISDVQKSFYLNSFFPRILSQICKNSNIRLITFGTDCVYKGTKGFYKETDIIDSKDIYGISKYLGEIHDFKDCITLRTSFIGKELNTQRGLLEWFITQSKLNKKVYGFKNAIYTGLPTIEIARIIHKFIIPNKRLSGLYHLSSEPIDKYSLLKLIKKTYSLDITINKDYDTVIDRSLDSSKFRSETGFIPLCWEELVKTMFINNL